MTELAPAFGIAAALVGIADTVPYVRDTLRGSTRPHRGTWLVWSVLAVLVCFSQEADGARWSLLMAGTQALLITLIFLLAIRRGVGGAEVGDRLMVAIAAAGVAGWAVADEPLIATACVVVADLIGVAMMVPKAYRDPDSETLATFALAGVSGALAAGAVGAPDPSLLLFPVYFCLVNAGLALLIHQRRLALPSLAGSSGTAARTP